MPAVFVHGVPETPAVWDALLSNLHREDVVALQLPGFGCARPDGFGATKEQYVTWLAGELKRLRADGPVDVVGHDWGGGFVVRLVSTQADLVRSWVTDAASLGVVNFEWHQFATIWQTPAEGEDFFDQLLAMPVEQRAGGFESLDRTMADCILALYRSALDVGREWAPDFRDIPVQGLVVVPMEDPFLSADLAREAARNAGAAVAELAGLAHWWMVQDPAKGAAMLEEFWANLS